MRITSKGQATIPRWIRDELGLLPETEVEFVLDVATGDPRWAAWSEAALEDAGDRAVLVVNPIIGAEVSVGFERIEDLDAALPKRPRFRTSPSAPMPRSWGIGC